MRQHPRQYYVPQIEPKENIEQWIFDWKDGNWQLPEGNWCGMCCLRMMALSLELQPPSLTDLYESATQKDVYRKTDGRIIGAYHHELAEFVSTQIARPARTAKEIVQSDIQTAVNNDEFLIASVSPQIRYRDGDPPQSRNGHLVLVYGYYEHEDEAGVILHNSTGFTSLNTQSHAYIPWKRFLDCFSGRGVFVSCGQ